jgi:hypothetical protein
MQNSVQFFLDPILKYIVTEMYLYEFVKCMILSRLYGGLLTPVPGQ